MMRWPLLPVIRSGHFKRNAFVKGARYIVVEGPLGVGKTTLARLLAEGQKITQDRVLVVAGNYTFTPHLLNEFRFGFSLDTEGTTNPFNGPAFAQSTGLQGLQNLFFDGVPELFVVLRPQRLRRDPGARAAARMKTDAWCHARGRWCDLPRGSSAAARG